MLTELRASLKAGQPASIGGYWLSPRMAADLEAAVFRLPPGHASPVHALEVASGNTPECTPALDNWVEAARQAGHACHAQAVQAPSSGSRRKWKRRPR